MSPTCLCEHLIHIKYVLPRVSVKSILQISPIAMLLCLILNLRARCIASAAKDIGDRALCYKLQIVATPDKKKVTAEGISLVETGPRMTLNPVKIISGGFSGPVIYSNPTYVSPNLVIILLSPFVLSFHNPI